MGNSKGRDNTKKRATRRKKTERLALAKMNATQPVVVPAVAKPETVSAVS